MVARGRTCFGANQAGKRWKRGWRRLVMGMKPKGPEQVDLDHLEQDRTDACHPVSSRPRVCRNLEGHPRVSKSSSHDEARPRSWYLPGTVPKVGPAPASVISSEAELCRACRAGEAVRWPACPDKRKILCWPLQTKSHGRCTPSHRRWARPGSPNDTGHASHRGCSSAPSPLPARGWTPARGTTLAGARSLLW